MKVHHWNEKTQKARCGSTDRSASLNPKDVSCKRCQAAFSKVLRELPNVFEKKAEGR